MEAKNRLPYEDAAELRKDIEGWVCRTCHRFYGKDEHAARYCCASDLPCACGNRHEKTYTCCIDCRNAKANTRFVDRELKAWDGKQMIYSDILDSYYSSPEDALDAFCDYIYDLADEDDAELQKFKDVDSLTTLTQDIADYLRLIPCNPTIPPYFDMEDFLYDSLPEDYNLDCEDINKIVNKWIQDLGVISYYPGKYRLSVKCAKDTSGSSR